MICWVHGANSTDRSFNYLKTLVPEHERVVFEYTVETPLRTNLQRLTELLEDKPVRGIIGHSLGGVMAALMVKRLSIERGVAIASPLGGSKIANFLPIAQVLVDIASTRPEFREIAGHTFDENFLSVVARQDQYSDGVVMIQSQMAARGSKIKTIDSNHFEVLLDPGIGELLNEHLF